MCNHNCSRFWNIFVTAEATLCPLSSYNLSIPISVSKNLPLLDISWNLIICSFLWLASFILHSVFKVPYCSMYRYFIPDNIAVYRYATIHLSIIYLMDIYIVLPFWLLWVMLPWTFIYMILCGHVIVSLGYITRSGIVVSNSNFVLSFWGNSRQFHSHSSVWRFQFLYILFNKYFLCFWLLPF